MMITVTTATTFAADATANRMMTTTMMTVLATTTITASSVMASGTRGIAREAESGEDGNETRVGWRRGPSRKGVTYSAIAARHAKPVRLLRNMRVEREKVVEAAGVEPASESTSPEASTCVSALVGSRPTCENGEKPPGASSEGDSPARVGTARAG